MSKTQKFSAECIDLKESENNIQEIMEKNRQDTLVRQSKDKIAKFPISVVPRSLSFLNIHSTLYLNFHKTFRDVKKEFFKDISTVFPQYIFHTDVLKRVIINGNFDRANKHNIDEKHKIKDYNCVKSWIEIEFPRTVQIQIESQRETYVFDETDIVDVMIKFLKKRGIDCKLLSYNNKPLVGTVKMGSVFSSSVNTLCAVKCDTKNNDEIYGSIYLIRTREFKSQSVYKIGKTENDINKRLGGYGKGGEVLYTIAVKQSVLDATERELIDLFRTKFRHRSDIGNEYFEGEFKNIIGEIHQKCFALI